MIHHPSFFELLESMDPEVIQMDSTGTERIILRFGRLAARIQDGYEKEIYGKYEQASKDLDLMNQYFGERTMATFNNYMHDDNKSSVEQVIKRVQRFGNLEQITSSSQKENTSGLVGNILWYLQYSSKEEREELIKCLMTNWRVAYDKKTAEKVKKVLTSSTNTLRLKI